MHASSIMAIFIDRKCTAANRKAETDDKCTWWCPL